MDGVEVMVDGEWTPVPSVKATGFEPVQASAWPEGWESTKTQWQMQAEVRESEPGAILRLLRDAEERARVARWAARWWLTHPYVPRAHFAARERRTWTGRARHGGMMR